MKTTKKDECSYSVSNAIRTLAMFQVFSENVQSPDEPPEIFAGILIMIAPRVKMSIIIAFFFTPLSISFSDRNNGSGKAPEAEACYPPPA